MKGNPDLDNLRSAIARAKDGRRAVERAPASDEEVQVRLDAMIATAAGRYRPPPLLEGIASARWNVLELERGHAPDPFAMACAIFPEPVRAYLAEHLQQVQGGIAAEDRTARLVELDGELAELERREEGLIRELEATGLDVDRRLDADPAAVLGP